MKRRIISMALAVVMVVLAIPVFSLAVTAAVADDRPISSTLETNGENWPTWVDTGSGAGRYAITPAGTPGLFGDGWSFGGFINGEFVPFSYNHASYGMISRAPGAEWDDGFVQVYNGVIGTGNISTNQLAFSYVAPYSGTVNVTGTVNFYAQTVDKFSFGILVDDTPALSDPAYVPVTAAGNLTVSATEVEVTAGQRISIVLNDTKTYWNNAAEFVSANVTYTKVTNGGTAGYTNDLGLMMDPLTTGEWGRFEGAPMGGCVAGTEVSYMDWTAWSAGAVTANGYEKFTHMITTDGWYGLESAVGNLWNGNGGFKSNYGTIGLTPTAENRTVAMGYTAEFTGDITFGVSKFEILDKKNEGAVNYFTVLVNGEVVWPANATSASDTENAYAVVSEDANVAAAMTAAMADTTVRVHKGDTVAFAMHRPVGGETNYIMLRYAPSVTYTSINYGAEFASAQAALNDAFAAKFTVDDTTLFAGTVENLGAYVNGDFVAAVDGVVTVGDIAAKEVADDFTVQSTYTLDGEEILGVEMTLSLADLLMQYVDGSESAAENVAVATLNYAAAAQNYFEYNAGNPANAALSNEQKARTYSETYDGKYSLLDASPEAPAAIHGIKLILNDTVDIAVYFNSDVDLTDAAAYTAIAMYGNSVEELYKADEIVLVEGSTTLYKAYFRGFTPATWGTDYTFGVMLADGSSAASDAVLYSISDYAARMQDTEVDAVVDAMLALYEAVASMGA